MEVKPLWKTATFWTAVGTIVTAAGGWAQDLMNTADSLEMIAIALIGIFIRRGMAKPTS